LTLAHGDLHVVFKKEERLPVLFLLKIYSIWMISMKNIALIKKIDKATADKMTAKLEPCSVAGHVSLI